MEPKSRLAYIHLVAAMFLVYPLCAQSLAAGERSIIQHLGKIQSLADQHGPGAPEDLPDSLDQENIRLGIALQKLTSEIPYSIRYKFSRLVENGMTIATSPDGLLRIYSWDAESGGSSHTINSVYQYKVGQIVYSKYVEDTLFSGTVSGVHLLAVNGKKYYLCLSFLRVAGLRGYESIQAFCLAGKILSDTAHIIKTKSGLTSKLGFDFVMDESWSGKDQIRYNDNTKTIRFPVVLEGGHITKRRITYKFNGLYFEKVE
jgi:hypothetical protein